MSKFILLSFCLTLSYFSYAEKVVEMDPNDIEMGGLIHESLPESLLKRIKYLSDTFEIVDGISYEESVDLYKRDLNPEANIVIYEEMARVYNKFCESMFRPRRKNGCIPAGFTSLHVFQRRSNK